MGRDFFFESQELFKKKKKPKFPERRPPLRLHLGFKKVPGRWALKNKKKNKKNCFLFIFFMKTLQNHFFYAHSRTYTLNLPVYRDPEKCSHIGQQLLSPC